LHAYTTAGSGQVPRTTQTARPSGSPCATAGSSQKAYYVQRADEVAKVTKLFNLTDDVLAFHRQALIETRNVAVSNAEKSQRGSWIKRELCSPCCMH
jgi:hypothetical protein